MKRLFAVLTILGFLIVPARSDETAKWCDQPASAAIPQIEEFLANGLPVEALNEYESQAYMKAARKFLEIPELPGVTIVVASVPGKGARSFIFKADKFCARLTMPWDSHVYAMKLAKGSKI